MSNEKKDKEIVSRASTATTQRTTIRLDQIAFYMDHFCHREREELLPENLVTLAYSVVSEGLQVPVEVFRDGQDNITLLKGHRRVSACRMLAGKNEPHFALDMEIDAIEVLGGTLIDRLLRSISDNEVRFDLDRVGRIRVAKKLHDAGVRVERAARAMGVSVKTYGRDLLAVRRAK